MSMDWDGAKTKAKLAIARTNDVIDNRYARGGTFGQIIGPDCPSCGSQTIQRHRKVDRLPFFGCRRYPQCRGTVT
jgi:ssDNA-binding Zn-finger/Zn-ribbon topoisomerase 1